MSFHPEKLCIFFLCVEGVATSSFFLLFPRQISLTCPRIKTSPPPSPINQSPLPSSSSSSLVVANLITLYWYSRTPQPPTVVCKMEAQLEYVGTHCIRVFARLAPICMLSRRLLTKFLHRRSSVEILSRVSHWLGSNTKSLLLAQSLLK